MSVAIKVEGLSKQYRLGQVGRRTLNHDINRWWHRVRGKEDPYLKIGQENDRTKKGDSEYVWSLREIDFEINHGDVLGIIGRNGAGKSTLLKILSKVTAPTTGQVKINGRIASLLEVGTGFHPDLSGRDNIFLNGAILGMTKNEIAGKFDEIVDFAGVERYIDTPVKRYSSGMYVRLAFAVAAHLEPEILIVDEVLAVGDAEFQKKCLGKMKDVSVNDGRTVLFVSHNMSAIRNLCDKSLFLSNGKVVDMGITDKIVNRYLGAETGLTEWNGLDGAQDFKILSTYIRAKSNSELFISDDLEIGAVVEAQKDFRDIVMGFNLVSSNGYPVARASFNDFNELTGLEKGKYLLKFVIPKYTLASGTYSIDFDFALPNIKRLNSKKINLQFELFSKGNIGDRYFVQNSPIYNSLVRTNWFQTLEKV